MKVTALDTETYKGKAFLLSWPNGVKQLERFGDFVEACKRLGKLFVFFNIDYDVSAILKYLPKAIVEKLYMEKWVNLKAYRLRYLPGKYFRIMTKSGGLHFFDLFPFFQTSLNTACAKHLGKKKAAMPKWLIKNLSPKNYRKHQKQVDYYAKKDSQLLQGLADIITGALQEIGLDVRALYSPGYIAKRYLKKQGFTIKDVPKKYRVFVEKAYFGARVEVVKRGYFPQVEIFDIKSAYPYALSQLPNFSNATFYKSKAIEQKWFFVRARLWMKEANSYPIPFWLEKENLIIFPRYRGQEAYLSSIEWNYLQNHDLLERFEIVEVLNVIVPFEKAFKKLVNTAFKKREESAGKKIFFKLVLTSLYGDFAESIKGYRPVEFFKGYRQALRIHENSCKRFLVSIVAQRCPKAKTYWDKGCDCIDCKFLRRTMRYKFVKEKPLFYHGEHWYEGYKKNGKFKNIALATMITASVRIRIFDMQRRAGKRFVACFTDSVIAEKGFSIRTGKNLGNWELKYAGKCWILGSGIYQTEKEIKTRGFVWRKKLTTILRKNSRKKIYHLPQITRVSLGQIVRRPKISFADFNLLKQDTKKLNINFDRKRVWERKFKNGGEVLKSSMGSQAIFLDSVD